MTPPSDGDLWALIYRVHAISTGRPFVLSHPNVPQAVQQEPVAITQILNNVEQILIDMNEQLEVPQIDYDKLADAIVARLTRLTFVGHTE